MNSPSETLRAEIISLIGNSTNKPTAEYWADQILTLILNKLPERKRYQDGEEGSPFKNGEYLGFNKALDTVRQLLEGEK